MILTSLPYDKGWKVYLDGKKIDTYKALDGLVAFDINDTGDHSLVIKYMPTEYVLGFIISGMGIAAFVLLSIFEYIVKKKKARPCPVQSDKWALDDFDRDFFELSVIENAQALENENSPEEAEALDENKDGGK